jgi:GTP pyrophosphokinase
MKQTGGEPTLAHADGVVSLLAGIGATGDMQAAAYLAYCAAVLNQPADTLTATFGDSLTGLAISANKLFQLQQAARETKSQTRSSVVQIENVRRMLLAFSKDLRVVMLLLASHLVSLRFATAQKISGFEQLSQDVLHIFSPLANRLGIWQIKWEMEDLAFRLLEPQVYKQVAGLLEKKRAEREQEIEQLRQELQKILLAQGIRAEIQGRPKNIYSIVKKMRGKSLQFEQVLDLRAMRIIVNNVEDCYRSLALVHQQMQAIDNEFDDYIVKPKANGYQSLHTVVSTDYGQVFEIQIRTRAMHEHAEFGVAAHWAYKEAGTKGYAGVAVPAEQAQKMAVLRQLLAWERELSAVQDQDNQLPQQSGQEKIYVLTPEAAIVELPQGATPVDFAYTLHTELGHRCRGAKLDGVLVPLSTRLQNGQTVEITTAKEGGPSRDWLNTDLQFIASPRAKAKVRAWFNAQQANQTISRGRELIEKLLQREGRTAYKLEDLAKKLGFESAAHLFEVVGKDEYSLRNIEMFLRPVAAPPAEDDKLFRKAQQPKPSQQHGGVLVVGMDSLLTQLAKCCRPAPPDDVRGYVTKGKGVSVHRAKCGNFLQLLQNNPDRVIEVAWHGKLNDPSAELYLVDIQVLADDRQGLLRDISEVFAREKMNVVGVKTQTIKNTAWMTFTVEVNNASGLNKMLSALNAVNGVRSARRH